MDNRTKKRKIGDLGEDIACRYLLRKGYKIIERNYWKPFGEIDIVTTIGKSIVFFEVKTVTRETSDSISHETGVGRNAKHRAEDNIHTWKIQRLNRAIESYVSRFKDGVDWQLDALIVSLDTGAKIAKIKHLEHIVL